MIKDPVSIYHIWQMPFLPIEVLSWNDTNRSMHHIQFSRNTQSWQCWHFCTTPNGNKVVMVNCWINFDANLHLTCYFESRYMSLTTVSTLMLTLPILCIARKHELIDSCFIQCIYLIQVDLTCTCIGCNNQQRMVLIWNISSQKLNYLC